MKKLIVATLIAMLMGAPLQGQVLQRPLSPRGLTDGITYFILGTALQEFSPSPSNGELAIRNAPGASPELVVWDAFNGQWTPFVLTGAAFSLPDDVRLNFGTDNDFFIRYWSGGDQLVFADHGSSAGYDFQASANQMFRVIHQTSLTPIWSLRRMPPAATSGEVVDLNITLNAMDGSDTVNGYLVDATQAVHSGSGNTFTAYRAENSGLTANVDEFAFSADGDWDATIQATNLRLRGGGAIRADDSIGNQIWVTNIANSVYDLAFTRTLIPGSSRGYILMQGTWAAANGADIAGFYAVDAMTDANHTGTGNVLSAVLARALSTPDTNAIHPMLNLESGWDALAVSDVDTDGWSPTDNPPTNSVAIYLDESADRGAGAGTADCAIVARLSSGTEVTVVVLVTDGGCP